MPFPAEVIGYQPKPERSEMPKGAEMRFSEYVTHEIRSGRFKVSTFWFRDDDALVTPGRCDLRFDRSGDMEKFNQTFSLTVRNRWFGLVRPAVYLQRGNDFVSDLLDDNEKRLLVDAWRIGHFIVAERAAKEKAEAELKRQRAAWWP